MADASVTLGLDSASFDKGLASAGKNLSDFGGKAESSLGRASEAHEKLFTSSHRAARSIGTMAKSFASGASGADMMATAMEGLERTLHLPLGALAGLAIGAVMFEEFSKAQKQIDEVRKSIEAVDKVASKPFSIFTDYKGADAKVNEAMEKAGAQGFWVDFWKTLKAPFVDPFGAVNAKGDTAAQIQHLTEAQAQIEAMQGKQERLPFVLQENVEAGLISKQIAEAIKNSLGLGENSRELFYEQIARQIADKNKDLTKNTLGELAARPEFFTPESEGRLSWIQEGMQARAAIQEQQMAEEERAAGHPEAAEEHLTKFADIVQGIQGLKQSEKGEASDIANGINAASILQNIHQAIEKITFINQ